MARTTTATSEMVVQAAGKIGEGTPAWQNLLAFLQSNYAGRPRPFDFDAAAAVLARLSDAEQNALIAWVVYLEETQVGLGRQRA